MVNWQGNYVITGVLLADFSLNVPSSLCSFPPPTSLPSFFHPFRVVLKQSESASRKSPVPISQWSVGVCVWVEWLHKPELSTAQWARQGSRGGSLRCVSQMDSSKSIGCQQQREMWSSVFLRCPFTTTVALTRTVALSVTYMFFLQPQLEQQVFIQQCSRSKQSKSPYPSSLETGYIPDIFSQPAHYLLLYGLTLKTEKILIERRHLPWVPGILVKYFFHANFRLLLHHVSEGNIVLYYCSTIIWQLQLLVTQHITFFHTKHMKFL